MLTMVHHPGSLLFCICALVRVCFRAFRASPIRVNAHILRVKEPENPESIACKFKRNENVE